MPDERLAYASQHIEEDDVAAAIAALRSDWLTGGPAVTAFEENMAGYCGARFGAAVSSATAGLHAACHALGIRSGDRVWTSPMSFVASANCALYCGAAIDFVDIDPRSYNICATEFKRKLRCAAEQHALPKALIAVHFGGHPCSLRELASVARPYGVAIIEDATHALGATYRGERIGSCRYSDAAVFSFHAIKSITTGEGGMVLTNREDLAQSVRRFRSHGIVRDTSEAEPWRYEQRELGYNYRMTDLQAALGTSQLKKIDAFIARRTQLAGRYDRGLADLPLQLPYRDTESTPAWHLYPICILDGHRGATRRKLYLELLRHGIASQVNYIPIHTQPFYRDLGFQAGQFPAAERYYDGALSLPLFVDLTERDQDRVLETVRTTLSEAVG